MNKRYISVLIAASLPACILSSAYSAELFLPASDNSTHNQLPIIKNLKKNNAVTEIKYAKLGDHPLSRMDTEISLPAFEGENFNYYKDDSSTYRKNNNGYIVWSGNGDKKQSSIKEKNTIKRDLLNEVTLVMKGDSLAGTYRIDGQLYQIWPLKNREVAIVKIDESKLNEEAEPDEDNVKNVKEIVCEPPGDYPGDSGPRSTVRVAIVTTDQTRKAMEGTDMNALTELAFTEANQAMLNSDVGIDFENAGILDAEFTEYGTYSEMRKQMLESSGSWLSSQIKQFRDKNRADLTVMLTEMSGNSTATNDAKKSNAFAVLNYRSYTGTYIFAHEMGHNIGASHDLDQYPDHKPKRLPCYRHGYKHEAPDKADRWRTVMSYTCNSGSCSRVNMFSNPRINYRGIPLGSKDFEDNSRRMNERRETVAAFYP